MKYLVLAVAVCFLAGCAQQVYLKKSPSEMVLTSIKSDNNKKVSYTFKSNIPDTLVLRGFQFDVNATYQSNLRIYMNTKYSVVENDSTNIEFELLSCNQTVRNANSGLQNTSNVLNALAGGNSQMYNNIVLTTEIDLKVTIKNGTNTLAEKKIFTTDEYNGDNNNANIAASSLHQAIGKSIIMIDKFVSSIQN